MPPESRDPAYLWDIVESAKKVQKFTTGLSFADYQRDEMRQMAVERGVEIIGEAARRLSQSFRAEHPELPWSRIIAQRNLLIHEYDDIDQIRIWEVATVHVATLLAILEPLLPPLPPESRD